ncbi:unnamed protein product [Microthlaspi erraticum]|uniref:DUF1985 domain-containing protein n=1 Tax=Microthlaspi erraticum TaxID=1685480 RepID=A0A6D2K884_9BRAS|nr:unnamed protein product [Microthlaspi erraticum]
MVFASGKPARFLLAEFGEITGLNCDEIHPDMMPEVDEEEKKRFWELLKLKENRYSPGLEDLKALCDECIAWSKKDKIRFCYLVILANGLLKVDRRSELPLDKANLVIDLERFENYPWGRVAFEDLMDAVKDVTHEKMQSKSYTLNGFVQVLQIWAYVAVPKVGATLGCPLTVPNEIPYLLRYQGRGGRLYISKAFSACKVRHMSTFNVKQINHTTNDPLVDNLVNYILEGRSMDGIVWQEEEYVQPKTSRKKKGGKNEEIQKEQEEEEEEDVPLLLERESRKKRKGEKKDDMKKEGC